MLIHSKLPLFEALVAQYDTTDVKNKLQTTLLCHYKIKVFKAYNKVSKYKKVQIPHHILKHCNKTIFSTYD